MDPSGDDEFHRAADLIAGGDPAGARDVLRRLAADTDRADVAGRALRLSATLDRVLGDLDSAVATARLAADLAGPDADLAAAAHAELGESLMAAGRPADAAAAYGSAVDRATTAGARTGLLRMRAFALAAAGRSAESTAILRDLAAGADPGLRAALLVHAAGAALGDAGKQTGGDAVEAARLWQEAHDAVDAAAAAAAPGVREAPDAAAPNAAAPGAAHALRADLAFVAAAAALDAGDLPRALAGIRSARTHALAGVAVLRYLAAAVAESAVAELLGDDRAAYGSLATGYATLGDVVGKALSGSTFDSPLRTLRDRWGADRFARAKRAYDDERRHRIGSMR